MLRFNSPVVTVVSDHAGADRAGVYIWSLVGGETGNPISIPYSHEVTVQLRTYAGVGDIVIQGSLEPSGGSGVFGPLDDPAGVALALNTAGQVETVLQNVYQLRPVAAAGASGVVVVLVR